MTNDRIEQSAIQRTSQLVGGAIAKATNAVTDSKFSAAAGIAINHVNRKLTQAAYIKLEIAVAVARMRRHKTSTAKMVANEKNHAKRTLAAGAVLFEKHAKEMCALIEAQNDHSLLLPLLTKWLADRYPTTGHLDQAIKRDPVALSKRAKAARALVALWNAANKAAGEELGAVAAFLAEKAKLQSQYEILDISREAYETGLVGLADKAKEKAAEWSALATITDEQFTDIETEATAEETKDEEGTESLAA